MLEFYDSEVNFDSCNIFEVIDLLKIISRDPNVDDLNTSFIICITNALIKSREEKLTFKISIPSKLEDAWDPTIQIKINDFACNALCVLELVPPLFQRDSMTYLIRNLLLIALWLCVLLILLLRNLLGG